MKLSELINKLEDYGKKHNLLDKTVKIYDDISNTCNDINEVEIETSFCQVDYKYPISLPNDLIDLDPSEYKQHNIDEYVEIILITGDDNVL